MNSINNDKTLALDYRTENIRLGTEYAERITRQTGSNIEHEWREFSTFGVVRQGNCMCQKHKCQHSCKHMT